MTATALASTQERAALLGKYLHNGKRMVQVVAIRKDHMVVEDAVAPIERPVVFKVPYIKLSRWRLVRPK